MNTTRIRIKKPTDMSFEEQRALRFQSLSPAARIKEFLYLVYQTNKITGTNSCVSRKPSVLTIKKK